MEVVSFTARPLYPFRYETMYWQFWGEIIVKELCICVVTRFLTNWTGNAWNTKGWKQEGSIDIVQDKGAPVRDCWKSNTLLKWRLKNYYCENVGVLHLLGKGRIVVIDIGFWTPEQRVFPCAMCLACWKVFGCACRKRQSYVCMEDRLSKNGAKQSCCYLLRPKRFPSWMTVRGHCCNDGSLRNVAR